MFGQRIHHDGRISCRRQYIKIADRFTTAPKTARDADLSHRIQCRKRLDNFFDDRPGIGVVNPLGGLCHLIQPLEDSRRRFSPETFQLCNLSLLGRFLQLIERGDA